MSLIERFSSRLLCIGFTPGRFTSVIRNGTAFVAKSAFQQTIINPLDDWQPLLNIFQNTLQRTAGTANRLPIVVVLSSRWCRMMMVPWSDTLLKDGSATHFLQTQYIALYGEAARDWVITTDDAPYGQPRLACGIERELLQGLQKIAMENKHRCQAIEPIISAAWRSVSDSLGIDTRAFAVIEEGQLTLAYAARGRIIAIQSHPCESALAEELVNAWKRWILRMPELDEITQVAVMNLTGRSIKDELPPLFKLVQLPTYELESVYSFLTCGRGR